MTVAKEVQVSDDDGATFHTLPGGTGEWNDEADQIEDTIFGQTFASTQPGLITWTSNANALYKGFAGYVAKLMSSGTSTALTTEPMSVVSGKTYKITDATKNVIDYTKAFTIKDNGVAVDHTDPAVVESLNLLFGRVTFASAYTPTGPITITGFYLPMTEIAKGSSFTLTQTVEPLDKTDFPTARANNGYRVFDPGLRTVTLEIGGFYASSSAFWEVLESRESFVVEINPDGSNLSRARGVFKLVTRNQSGDVGALEEETRNFGLSVPEGLPIPFGWLHETTTTLSQAIQIILAAFIDQTNPTIRYLPDGPADISFTGEAVLTDVSLSSALDAMNEFTANFQGTGQPVREVA